MTHVLHTARISNVDSIMFVHRFNRFTNIMVSNRDTHLQNRTNTTVWHIQVYFKLNREKKNDNKSYHSRRMIHLLLHSFLFIFKLLPECCQLTQDISIWCISPDRFFEKIKLNFNWRSSWLLNKFSLSVPYEM